KGPRAPFHPPLKPSHDVTVGNESSGLIEQSIFCQPLAGVSPLCVVAAVHDCACIGVGVVGSPVTVSHYEAARLLQYLIPDLVRGAESSSAVGCSRLDIQIGEWRVVANLSIGHAVHRASAGETKPRVLGPRPQSVQHV